MIRKAYKSIAYCFCLILSISAALNIDSEASVSELISKGSENFCKNRVVEQCDPYCLDGFGSECYLDSIKYNVNEFDPGEHALPEETKQACLAIYSYATCGSCFSKFELKINGKFEEVSCEEFFEAIEGENEDCNNCLDVIYSGCC